MARITSSARHGRRLLMLLIAGSGIFELQAQSPRYAIVDLVEGFAGTGEAINDNGVVAGSSLGLPSEPLRGFVARQGQLDYMLAPPVGQDDAWTLGYDINLAEQVVGKVNTDEGYRAVMWRAGKPVLVIEPLGGQHSEAFGINNAGDIAGHVETQEDRRPILYTDGQIIDLGSFGGEVGHALAVNDQRQVCGFSFDANVEKRSFIWQDGLMTDLGDLGDPERSVEAHDINESGAIVGHAHVNRNEHAFIWRDGIMTDIHGAGFFDISFANAMNDVGEVVGAMTGAGQLELDPFVWDEEHGMRNLYDLIPPNFEKWDLRAAQDINNAGQIIIATEPDVGPVVATPFVQEFTLTDVSPGRAGETNGIRAAGLEPGERVYFMYSERGGGAIIPDCDILDAVMQVDGPTLIGAKTANAQGKATLRFHVPNAARNRGEILIQAVVPDSCRVSNLVVTQFE